MAILIPNLTRSQTQRPIQSQEALGRAAAEEGQRLQGGRHGGGREKEAEGGGRLVQDEDGGLGGQAAATTGGVFGLISSRIRIRVMFWPFWRVI